MIALFIIVAALMLIGAVVVLIYTHNKYLRNKQKETISEGGGFNNFNPPAQENLNSGNHSNQPYEAKAVDFGNAIYDCFTKRYMDFTGRSRRSEYFPFLIVVVFVYACCRAFFEDTPILAFIVAIILDIPLLAVTARRLHDVGKSGWWMLCPILPIFWMFKDSDVGSNQWGISPKYPD